MARHPNARTNAELIADCTSAARQCAPGTAVRETLERAAARIQTLHDRKTPRTARHSDEAVAAAALEWSDERDAFRAALVLLRKCLDEDSIKGGDAEHVLPLVDLILKKTEA